MITPGKIVQTFSTKTGKPAILRYPESRDVVDLTNFINTFSKENRFTRFAGEQLSEDEEKKYLESELAGMAAKNIVKLFCYVDGVLAGVCDVHRDFSLWTRKQHVGILGIIISQEYRGQGIGEALIRTTIQEAGTELPNLKLIKLECFSVNTPALSLYQKVGFSEVGRVPKSLKYNDEYVDEVIMVKEVA